MSYLYSNILCLKALSGGPLRLFSINQSINKSSVVTRITYDIRELDRLNIGMAFIPQGFRIKETAKTLYFSVKLYYTVEFI